MHHRLLTSDSYILPSTASAHTTHVMRHEHTWISTFLPREREIIKKYEKKNKLFHFIDVSSHICTISLRFELLLPKKK